MLTDSAASGRALFDTLNKQIMSKLLKQRKDSIKSYSDGGRQDLVDAEQAEVTVISEYMPHRSTPDEIEQIVLSSIAQVSATTVKDMGKVMALVRPLLAGKADMSDVGDLVKKRLASK